MSFAKLKSVPCEVLETESIRSARVNIQNDVEILRRTCTIHYGRGGQLAARFFLSSPCYYFQITSYNFIDIDRLSI
jgi:hypothetical protein